MQKLSEILTKYLVVNTSSLEIFFPSPAQWGWGDTLHENNLNMVKLIKRYNIGHIYGVTWMNFEISHNFN